MTDTSAFAELRLTVTRPVTTFGSPGRAGLRRDDRASGSISWTGLHTEEAA